jgi:hypothetical protein
MPVEVEVSYQNGTRLILRPATPATPVEWLPNITKMIIWSPSGQRLLILVPGRELIELQRTQWIPR